MILARLAGQSVKSVILLQEYKLVVASIFNKNIVFYKTEVLRLWQERKSGLVQTATC